MNSLAFAFQQQDNASAPTYSLLAGSGTSPIMSQALIQSSFCVGHHLPFVFNPQKSLEHSKITAVSKPWRIPTESKKSTRWHCCFGASRPPCHFIHCLLRICCFSFKALPSSRLLTKTVLPVLISAPHLLHAHGYNIGKYQGYIPRSTINPL